MYNFPGLFEKNTFLTFNIITFLNSVRRLVAYKLEHNVSGAESAPILRWINRDLSRKWTDPAHVRVWSAF
jgi:hypothetical protein